MNELLKQWAIEFMDYLFVFLLSICFLTGLTLMLGMIIILSPLLLILLAIVIIIDKQKPIYYGCVERVERVERMETRKENKNESIN
jgi:ABC-type protease/lipase transport system fused ATPase/permease subunit